MNKGILFRFPLFSQTGGIMEIGGVIQRMTDKMNLTRIE